MDRSNFLDEIISLLEANRIAFCLIGGQAVNAYVEPLVSLDLDIAVAVDQISEVRTLIESRFRVDQFPHSLNVGGPGSQLRVQIQTDPRYGDFVQHAAIRDVLGLRLPVAALEDVLQGKIWAAADPEPSDSKRHKDLLDIERILEAYPDLRPRVPQQLLDRLSSL